MLLAALLALSFAHRLRFNPDDEPTLDNPVVNTKKLDRKNNIFWAKFILNVVANDLLGEDYGKHFEEIFMKAMYDCSESLIGDYEGSEGPEGVAFINEAIMEMENDFGGEGIQENQVIKRKCPTMAQLEWFGSMPDDGDQIFNLCLNEVEHLPNLLFHKSQKKMMKGKREGQTGAGRQRADCDCPGEEIMSGPESGVQVDEGQDIVSLARKATFKLLGPNF